MSLPANDDKQSSDPALDAEVIKRIEEALTGLRFGAIEITVHDGRIVQIERREKYRFEQRPR
jgi:hypothetical protein